MLKPEVRFLETLQCLIDRGCVFLKSVHLGIRECRHFLQCTVSPGAGGIVRQWGYTYVYSVLSDLLFFFYISSTDCPSVVGSTWDCVLWDVNKWPLIASHSCRNCLCFDPLCFRKQTIICTYTSLFCSTFCSLLVFSVAIILLSCWYELACVFV